MLVLEAVASKITEIISIKLGHEIMHCRGEIWKFKNPFTLLCFSKHYLVYLLFLGASCCFNLDTNMITVRQTKTHDCNIHLIWNVLSVNVKHVNPPPQTARQILQCCLIQFTPFALYMSLMSRQLSSH